MKLGYQTIIFGPVFPNRKEFEHALEIIAGAGFTGVEIMQRPDRLGLGEEPHFSQDLAPILEKHRLSLVGLAGGTVEERVRFLDDAFRDSADRPYLYVEDWHAEDEALAKVSGVALALHAHYQKRVHNLEEAGPLLRSHQDLKWIPDTAHLFIVGADLNEAIQNFYDQMVAVHLNDWTAEFGRVSGRYARGFVELGRGDVHPEEPLQWLLQKRYRGWVIAEQGSPSTSPEDSVWRVAEWLRTAGAPISPRARFPTPNFQPPPATGGQPRLEFLQKLNDSVTRSSPDFFVEVARSVKELYRATLVGIRAYSDWNQSLTLLARSWAMFPADNESWAAKGTIYEIPLARLGHELFCLDNGNAEFFQKSHPHLNFPHLNLARRLNAMWLLSIPVTHSFNPNHVRFLIDILAEDKSRLLTQDADRISSDIARGADGHTNELCIDAAAKATVLSGRGRQISTFLDDLCVLIRETIRCEGCTILLQKVNAAELTVQGSTGIEWNPALQEHERNYTPDDRSMTMEIFKRREARIYRTQLQIDEDRHRLGLVMAKSWETVPSCKTECALVVPVLDRDGKCIGVLRCRNKRSTGGTPSFTDTDLAVIDSIFQVIVPLLFAIRAEERRTLAFRHMKHEFRRPLVALQAVLDNLESEVNSVPRQVAFERDYFGDAFSWIDLMFGLIGKLDLISRGRDVVVPRVSLIGLRSVLTPVIRMLRKELEEKKIQREAIEYGDLDIPRLFIDRNLFEQVVFNLLDNAIKYAAPNPRTFRVRIDGSCVTGGFVLTFQDWGTGVDEGLEEAIFREGVRAPGADRWHVSGEGLGLSLVRRIVEAHDGTIWLASLRNPTEFRIFLPHWIAESGPRGAERRGFE